MVMIQAKEYRTQPCASYILLLDNGATFTLHLLEDARPLDHLLIRPCDRIVVCIEDVVAHTVCPCPWHYSDITCPISSPIRKNRAHNPMMLHHIPSRHQG